MKIIQITLDSINTIDEGLHVVVTLFLAWYQEIKLYFKSGQLIIMLLIIQIIKKYNIISNLDISNNFKSICLGRERPWQSSSWPSCPPGVMLRIMKLTKFVNKTV